MNVKFYECVNERKIFLNKSHQKFTWEGVEPTTLWLSDHCSTIFTITFSYNYLFFIKFKSCPFWFVDSPFCCKCSYDIQQEDICIKPRSIGFQVWKVLLVKIRLMKQSSPKLQNVWRKGTLNLWTSSFLLHHFSHSNISICRKWRKFKPVFFINDSLWSS